MPSGSVWAASAADGALMYVDILYMCSTTELGLADAGSFASPVGLILWGPESRNNYRQSTQWSTCSECFYTESWSPDWRGIAFLAWFLWVIPPSGHWIFMPGGFSPWSDRGCEAASDERTLRAQICGFVCPLVENHMGSRLGACWDLDQRFIHPRGQKVKHITCNCQSG